MTTSTYTKPNFAVVIFKSYEEEINRCYNNNEFITCTICIVPKGESKITLEKTTGESVMVIGMEAQRRYPDAGLCIFADGGMTFDTNPNQ